MQIDGQCHCGAISYVAEIDPDLTVICHCNDCQALTGTAFRVTARAQRDHLTITGQPVIYEKIAESGAKRFMHFCGTCGSPLFSNGEGAHSNVWGIRWGGIRQRDELKPTRQIWRQSAPPWVCAFEDAPASARE